MALRKTILATTEIYHIYNRGVEKRPIFLNKRDYVRFLDATDYYRFVNCPMKFSYFRKLALKERGSVFKKLEGESKRFVDIFAFCLMPNHFHFLLKQLTDKGISKFMAKITNGFSHYFNIRHARSGYLFQGNFGAVRVEDDEQFIHVSRYIHLNPVASYLIEVKNLASYEYSSYPEYMGKSSRFTNTKEILSYFKDPKEYKKFIEDHADYARKIADIQHLTLE
jgi:putative transposase